MKKSIRYIVLFLLIMTASFWTCLQFDAVQTWAKSKASQVILQETGCTLTAGSFGGAPPFLLSVDNVELTHPDIGRIKINSATIMPSWLEMMFGRLSFVWVTADGIDLSCLEIKNSEQPIAPSKKFLPPVSFAIHSLHLEDITLPKAYYEVLLNTYSDQSTVDCVYTVTGRMSWNPRKEKLLTSVCITPHAGNSRPLTIDATLKANALTTTLSANIDALKVADGSVFFSLPCDRLSLDATMEAQTQDLLQTLFGTVEAAPDSLFTGSWSLSGIHREKAHAGLNPVVRFGATGHFKAENKYNFSFETADITCQKIEPVQSYPQDKKEQLSQELLLANADDPQDASTLSRITNIPTPRSIQGSLKVKGSHLSGTLMASSLTVGDHSIPSCTIAVHSETCQNRSVGTLRADLAILHNSKQIPFTLSSTFSSSNPFTWQFPEICVSAAGHQIAGNLDLHLFPVMLQGKLESTSDKAPQLAELLDATIGKLHCLAVFDAEEEAKLQLTLEALGYKAMTCNKASLETTAKGIFSNPFIKTTLTASNFEKESLFLHSIALESTLDPKEPLSGNAYSIHIDGQSTYGPCQLTSTGLFSENFFTLNTFHATSGGHTITNSAPLHVVKDKDGLHIYPFEFTSDTNMVVSGDAVVSDACLKASLQYANLPLESFDPFLGDITLFGTISGQLELSGKKSDPQLVMTVASSALSLWNPHKTKAPPLTASCEVIVQRASCMLQVK